MKQSKGSTKKKAGYLLVLKSLVKVSILGALTTLSMLKAANQRSRLCKPVEERFDSILEKL